MINAHLYTSVEIIATFIIDYLGEISEGLTRLWTCNPHGELEKKLIDTHWIRLLIIYSLYPINLDINDA